MAVACGAGGDGPAVPPAEAMRQADAKKPPEGGFLDRLKTDYLLAAMAAAPAAAEAAASMALVAAVAAVAAVVAAAPAIDEAASATDEAASATDDAAAATGAATVAAASSFLPQAVRAAAAIRVANSSDLFICVLSEKCRSTNTVRGDPTCSAKLM